MRSMQHTLGLTCGHAVNPGRRRNWCHGPGNHPGGTGGCCAGHTAGAERWRAVWDPHQHLPAIEIEGKSGRFAFDFEAKANNKRRISFLEARFEANSVESQANARTIPSELASKKPPYSRDLRSQFWQNWPPIRSVLAIYWERAVWGSPVP